MIDRGEVHRVRKFMQKVSTRSSALQRYRYAQNPDLYEALQCVLEQQINSYSTKFDYVQASRLDGS